MSTPKEAAYRVYTNEQGAERINSAFVKASTLARLARKKLVPYTKNGRKVGWTDEQLAGVVAYLAHPGKQPKTTITPAPTPTPSRETQPARRGDITPLVARPGRRYGLTA